MLSLRTKFERKQKFDFGQETITNSGRILLRTLNIYLELILTENNVYFF